MKARNDLWIWIDLEMTGLDLSKCVIVEIATVITDKSLNIIAEGPDIVIKRSKADMAKMEEWPKKMHEKSGLLSSIETSNIKLKEAEKITLDFISKYVEKNSSPLCGNTIYQDRMFLKKEMQKLEEFLHYRNLDVSTLKELYKSWKGDIGNLPVKKSNHRAMTDILESIDEMKWYKENFLSF